MPARVVAPACSMPMRVVAPACSIPVRLMLAALVLSVLMIDGSAALIMSWKVPLSIWPV